MRSLPCYLHDFDILRPKYTSTQTYALEWLLEAHTKAEIVKHRNLAIAFDAEQFRAQMKREIDRVACKATQIKYRGYCLGDFKHQNWEEMELYRLEESPQGVSLQKRMQFQTGIVDQVFEHFYPEGKKFPSEIVHVSCTGYASPSGPQKIVSKRGLGDQVEITHAYHMGCYASIPAIRIGSGFVLQGKESVDVVHTEFSSIHFNPLLHSPDQLVSQSLFADGFIQYSVSNEPKKETASFRVLDIYELIVPQTQEDMKWVLSEWGFHLTLTKEIPFLIARYLKEHFRTLCKKAGVKEEEIIDRALFAIHPGGPRILESVRKIFRCSKAQLDYSEQALQNWGNMSSATLPHIWHQICADSSVPSGTKVFSLAFGPGLTIAGILLEKVG